MFIETANWIREQVAELDLHPGQRAVDMGSSTLHYRTVEQPHVDREVFAPLRQRGVDVLHSDIKDAEGVDVVFDVCNGSNDATSAIGGNFDLVISVGMLQVIPDWRRGIDVLTSLARPGGYLIVESPQIFRRVADPDDNYWRPSPEDIFGAFGGCAKFEMVKSASLRIDTDQQYRGLVSRPSWTLFANRWWLPVPGVSERARFHVKRWRWRDSVVLLRRAGSSARSDLHYLPEDRSVRATDPL